MSNKKGELKPKKRISIKRNHACNLCNFASSSKTKLICHIKTKHKKCLKKCKLCHISFLDATSLSLHNRNHITRKPNVFKCSCCLQAFFNKYKLRIHEHKHGINRRDEGIITKKIKHTNSHDILNNGYLFKCKICMQPFRRKRNLDTHYLKHEESGIFTCKYCKSRVPITEFKSHASSCFMFKNINERKPILKVFKCPYCETLFYRENLFNQHIMCHKESNDQKIYICKFCMKKFSSPNYLFGHFKSHHPLEKPFLCLVCNIKFEKRQDFSNHIKELHGKIGSIKLNSAYMIVYEDKVQTDPLSFKHYGKINNYKSKNIYSDVLVECRNNENKTQTITINKKQKRSTQRVCNRKINKKNDDSNDFVKVYNTRKKSNAIKKFTTECTICGIKLKKRSLQKHINHHQLVTKYTCHLCSSSFRTKDKLNYHVLQHFKNDKKLCSCGIKFKSELEKQQHETLCHVSVKPNSKFIISNIIENVIKKCNITDLDDDSILIVDAREKTPESNVEFINGIRVEINKANESVPIVDNSIFKEPIILPKIDVKIQKVSEEEVSLKPKFHIKSEFIDVTQLSNEIINQQDTKFSWQINKNSKDVSCFESVKREEIQIEDLPKPIKIEISYPLKYQTTLNNEHTSNELDMQYSEKTCKDNTVLVNVNPLAHLIDKLEKKPQKAYYKTKTFDYETIIKNYLQDFDENDSSISQKKGKKERKKYYKTKDYDYASVIGKTLGISVSNKQSGGSVQVSSNNNINENIDKIDYATLVKESIGDESVFEDL